MYHVSVFANPLPLEMLLDSRDFAFGTFAEIGFWLDHYGYNDPEYRVVITFS